MADRPYRAGFAHLPVGRWAFCISTLPHGAHVCYDRPMNTPEHKHKFQIEGTTWTCWGWTDACGLRAPACFTPVPEATTRKGLIDLVIGDTVSHADAFTAEHLTIVTVP